MIESENRNTWKFFLSDILALEISLVLSLIIRFGSSGLDKEADIYIYISIVIFLASSLVAFIIDEYRDIIIRGAYREFVSSFCYVFLVCSLLISFLFFIKKSSAFSRLVIGNWFLLGFLLLYIFRLFTKRQVEKNSITANKIFSFVLMEEEDPVQCEKIEENLRKNGYKIAGFGSLEEGHPNEEQGFIRGMENVEEFILRNVVDEVFIIIRGEKDPRLSQFLNDLYIMKIPYRYQIFGNPESPYKVSVSKIGREYFINGEIHKFSKRDLILKRLLDIVGAIVGLIITGIISLVLVPAIKLTSPGPAIFVQDRVGKNGRIFKFYKFRSMYQDAEERKMEFMAQNTMQGLMFKVEDDPRITPVGKFIRKTSLDEFPQFFNVLKGDMSLVGTRPPTVDEYEKYSKHHKARLAMKPGITGNWQVSGRSDITDFEEIVELDCQYIDNWTIGLDIKILIKTVLAVFKREGAK